MTRIEVTPRAAADVDAVLVYVHGWGGRAAAERQQAELREATQLLADHPEIGRRRPDIGVGLRSILVHPYVLIYRHDRARDTVFILRVLHGRRLLALDGP